MELMAQLVSITDDVFAIEEVPIGLEKRKDEDMKESAERTEGLS
jgi:hypothetical protein